MDIPAEIEQFKKDWEIDFGRRRISRKSVGPVRAFLELILLRQYPVIAFYRFAQEHLATEQGIVFPNFVDRNQGNEVAGVPSWFNLSEQWHIPEGDLKYLFLGPLVQGDRVLVPAYPEHRFMISIWDMVKIFGTIGSAVGFLVWIVSLLT
ncbi:MAG: hypothetical protein IIA07_14095 [Proteobacteria bacterium]|nr:hypothetical protein [Pseudomonadota bacterium]